MVAVTDGAAVIGAAVVAGGAAVTVVSTAIIGAGVVGTPVVGAMVTTGGAVVVTAGIVVGGAYGARFWSIPTELVGNAAFFVRAESELPPAPQALAKTREAPMMTKSLDFIVLPTM